MKKIITFLLMFVCAFSFSSTLWAQELEFKDVSKDAWYYDDLAYLVDMDVIHGISATEFVPNRNITRAEYISLIVSLSKVDVSNLSGETDFVDVSVNSWYAKNVQWAAENKLIAGKTVSEFAPEDNITREEAAFILYLYDSSFGGIAEGDGESVFNSEFNDDAMISSWAKEAIYNMVEKNVIYGFEGAFRSQNNLQRCESVSLFANYMEKLTAQENQEYNGVKINAGDIVVYSEKLIDDEEKLYDLATDISLSSKQDDSSLQCESTITETTDGEEGIALSGINSETIPTYDYTQHYMTIQRADGNVEEYYSSDVLADIKGTELVGDYNFSLSGAESSNDRVTPGSGTSDPYNYVRI